MSNKTYIPEGITAADLSSVEATVRLAPETYFNKVSGIINKGDGLGHNLLCDLTALWIFGREKNRQIRFRVTVRVEMDPRVAISRTFRDIANNYVILLLVDCKNRPSWWKDFENNQSTKKSIKVDYVDTSFRDFMPMSVETTNPEGFSEFIRRIRCMMYSLGVQPRVHASGNACVYLREIPTEWKMIAMTEEDSPDNFKMIIKVCYNYDDIKEKSVITDEEIIENFSDITDLEKEKLERGWYDFLVEYSTQDNKNIFKSNK